MTQQRVTISRMGALRGRLDILELTLTLLCDSIDRHLKSEDDGGQLQLAATQARAILQGDE